jgi:hypothetical protein
MDQSQGYGGAVAGGGRVGLEHDSTLPRDELMDRDLARG